MVTWRQYGVDMVTVFTDRIPLQSYSHVWQNNIYFCHVHRREYMGTSRITLGGGSNTRLGVVVICA
jgi:hypothetical protein